MLALQKQKKPQNPWPHRRRILRRYILLTHPWHFSSKAASGHKTLTLVF